MPLCEIIDRHDAYQVNRLRSELISDGIRLTPKWSGQPPSELEFSVFNLRFIFMVKFTGVPPSGLVGGTWGNKVRRRDLWMSPEMCRGHPDAKWRAQRHKERDKMRRKSKKKENTDLRKEGKPRSSVFQWFGAPGGRKVGSRNRRVRSELATWQIRLRCEANSLRTNVERWAKRISKSTSTKHKMFRQLLEFEVSKKCTPLRCLQDCSVFQVICFEKERSLADFLLFHVIYSGKWRNRMD